MPCIRVPVMELDFIVEREEEAPDLPPLELTGWESIVFELEDVESG